MLSVPVIIYIMPIAISIKVAPIVPIIRHEKAALSARITAYTHDGVRC